MPTKPKQKKPKEEFDEFDRIIRWRFKELRALGLAPDQAISLIEIPDIGHRAQSLADKGCPPALIAQLLAGD